MIVHRPSSERGRGQADWLDSRFSFSFAEYHDPAFMGFGPLRVINEDVIAPAGGFATHGHRDMEIITYVLSGALEHKDSTGGGSIIRPSEVQRMSAGSGIRHSEFNASDKESVHLLQIWIEPDKTGIAPGYEQKLFDPAGRDNRLQLVCAAKPREGALTIQQDAQVFAATLEAGKTIRHQLAPKRRCWLQIARGAVRLGDLALATGDGAAVTDQGEIVVEGVEAAEFLLFDLP